MKVFLQQNLDLSFHHPFHYLPNLLKNHSHLPQSRFVIISNIVFQLFDFIH